MIVVFVYQICNQHRLKAVNPVLKTMLTIGIHEMSNKHVTSLHLCLPLSSICMLSIIGHRENSCRIQCLFQNENSLCELCCAQRTHRCWDWFQFPSTHTDVFVWMIERDLVDSVNNIGQQIIRFEHTKWIPCKLID